MQIKTTKSQSRPDPSLVMEFGIGSLLLVLVTIGLPLLLSAILGSEKFTTNACGIDNKVSYSVSRR